MAEIKADILIIGGGVPGLALAALLAPLGIKIALADRHKPPPLAEASLDGRTAALMQGSVNIVKATGAWDLAAPYGAALETLRIIDDSAGREEKPVQIEFEAPEIHLDAFGVNMPNGPLRAALGEIVAALDNVTLIEAGMETYSADDFKVHARFENGDEVSAKLIVGADGRNSPTRELAGIGVWERDYKQQAITCLIGHTKSHRHVSTEYHRPSGPFTLVPMPNNKDGFQSSVVWVDYAEEAARYIAMSKHAFERALQERSRGLLGQISLVTPPHSWPLKALKAKAMTAKRVALMAESAHVIHPMGAQGLNLSLRDTAALAEIIADAMRLGLDPGSKTVLDQYAARRRQDVLSRVIGTDGLNRMVSNNYGLTRRLRKLGLKTLEHVTPLREFTMQQGIAPMDQDGRLAKGEAL